MPTSVGAPLGVDTGTYQTTLVSVPDGAVLLLFTDGLVERRQESIDDGLDRLAAPPAASTTYPLMPMTARSLNG